MESETTSDDSSASSAATLPGARLREARERQGLSLEEVAEDLRLMPSQIRALEEDDHQRFAAPIYIIGYVRKYAERLGLDPDPLVMALEPTATRPPPLTSELTARRIPMPGHGGLPPMLWLLAAIAGVVVLLAALWWLTRPAPLPLTPPDEEAPVAEQGEVMPGVPVDEAAGEVAEEPPAPSPEEPLTRLPVESPAEAEMAPAETPPAVAAEPAELTAPEGPMDELVLRFSGSSWVEVLDVTGRRLAYRMGEAGDLLRLRGLAPFDILLGNAPNVSVEYNGEPYRDFPVNRHNVATFTLGHPADDAGEQ